MRGMINIKWILVWGVVAIGGFFALSFLIQATGARATADGARRESASLFSALALSLTPDGSLEAEVTRLRAVSEEHARTLVLFEALRSENGELRRLLALIDSEGGIPAAVVQRPPQLAYDTVLLETEPQEIAPGSLVMSDSEVIGRVIADEGKYVRAELFSSSRSSVSVMLASSSVALTLEGRGGGLMSISVPKDVLVSVGEAVVAPSLHTRILGSVVDVVADEHLPSKAVYVRATQPIERLRFVRIVAP